VAWVRLRKATEGKPKRVMGAKKTARSAVVMTEGAMEKKKKWAKCASERNRDQRKNRMGGPAETKPVLEA